MAVRAWRLAPRTRARILSRVEAQTRAQALPRALTQVATALASAAFGLSCAWLWLARAPDSTDGTDDEGDEGGTAPRAWLYLTGAALPAWLLVYNCAAALCCMLPEYR